MISIDEFPDCCGAEIPLNFLFEDASNYNWWVQQKKRQGIDITAEKRRLREDLTESLKHFSNINRTCAFLICILTQTQNRHWGATVRRNGFKAVSKGLNKKTGNNLTVYIKVLNEVNDA